MTDHSFMGRLADLMGELAGSDERYVEDILAQTSRMGQRPMWAFHGSWLPRVSVGERRGRPASHMWALLLATTAFLIVAVIGALVVLRAPAIVGPGAPTETPPTTPSPAPTGGSGSVLTWSKLDVASLGLSERTMPVGVGARVAFLDDRFVLVDVARGAAMTSADGMTWDLQQEDSRGHDYYDALAMESVAIWQDQVVGWGTTASNSLRIVRPPEEPRTYEFEGTIGAAGIGRAGILVRTHSTLNFDDYVTSLLGPGWVDQMTSFSFKDGVLRITTDDGRELEIVWAEHGFEPGDVADSGFGWHSLDGVEWTAIPDFPDNVNDIVGVDDGFIARGSAMWHSADGLTWRRLGPYTSGSFASWMGGALAAPDQSERRRFDLWTSDGPRRLSIASGLGVTYRATGAGSLGIVALGTDDTVLYSPDGIDWSIAPVPEEMVADADSRTMPTVAVGERSVVALVWRDDWRDEMNESRSPSLWLGTLEP
jgi:hypothetical protein